ncbi:MAG: hypothetical protein LBT05_01765 [Planctomycetaceae bacterium]|nr:hypothetical protein [Planctomycetaceae bacterium]
MKKLIALALMVVCVGTFSLGCTPKKEEPAKPATGGVVDEKDASQTPAPTPAGGDAAPEAPAAP